MGESLYTILFIFSRRESQALPQICLFRTHQLLCHSKASLLEACINDVSSHVEKGYIKNVTGLVSAQDAIRFAYFRDVQAKLASSPSSHAPRGAMMAIGASLEDAQTLCHENRFASRMQVAAVNSSSTVTLSSDEGAIDDA